MKVAIITDQHFGVKKGSKIYHEYFKKFYDEVFFPTLEKEKISVLIDMGDTFDNRKVIDLWSLKWAQDNYYDTLDRMGIDVYTIVGNHTAYYKNTNEVNTLQLVLGKYNNIISIPQICEHVIGNLKILFVPWINEENEEETKEKIKNSDATVVMGHLELSGFPPYRGVIQENGLDPTIFSKYRRVFSGHYHTRSDNGKIFYLGNPYQLYWNDYNDKRGFHIIDTETLKLKTINNPYDLFLKIYYNDTDHNTFDFNSCENRYVKLVIEKKTNSLNYETFLDKLISSNCHEVKIIENFSTNVETVSISQIEDTISILSSYVEGSEIDLDKKIIMNHIEEIYRKASEIE